MEKQVSTLYQLRQIPANSISGPQLTKALELVRFPANAAERQIWRALMNQLQGMLV